MINSLQLIMLTVCFNLRTPVNVQKTEIQILGLVSFDVFDTGKLYKKIFQFNETMTPPYTDKFAEASMESSNFILELGPVFIIEIFYLLVVAFHPVMLYLCKGENFRCTKSI